MSFSVSASQASSASLSSASLSISSQLSDLQESLEENQAPQSMITTVKALSNLNNSQLNAQDLRQGLEGIPGLLQNVMSEVGEQSDFSKNLKDKLKSSTEEKPSADLLRAEEIMQSIYQAIIKGGGISSLSELKEIMNDLGLIKGMGIELPRGFKIFIQSAISDFLSEMSASESPGVEEALEGINNTLSQLNISPGSVQNNGASKPLASHPTIPITQIKMNDARPNKTAATSTSSSKSDKDAALASELEPLPAPDSIQDKLGAFADAEAATFSDPNKEEFRDLRRSPRKKGASRFSHISKVLPVHETLADVSTTVYTQFTDYIEKMMAKNLNKILEQPEISDLLKLSESESSTTGFF